MISALNGVILIVTLLITNLVSPLPLQVNPLKLKGSGLNHSGLLRRAGDALLCIRMITGLRVFRV